MVLSSEVDSDTFNVDPPLTVIPVPVLNDFTAQTIIDSSSTSNPTAHSKSDVTDGVIVHNPVFNMQDEGTAPGEETKAKDPENKKTQMVE
jgi:hypothetical protein